SSQRLNLTVNSKGQFEGRLLRLSGQAGSKTRRIKRMMLGRCFLPSLLIILSLSVSPSLAASPQQAYADGLDHLYSLDFSASEASFRSLTRDYPDNPDYWNALASSYLLKTLYDQQKLNMESFDSKDRFGPIDSKDSVSEAEEKQLRDTIDKAIN